MYKVEIFLTPNKFNQSDTANIINNAIENTFVINLTILKNSNIFSKKNEPVYNLYQFDLQINLDVYNKIINNSYIVNLNIYESINDLKILSTYLYIDKHQFIRADRKTGLISVRIIAYNIIVRELLKDKGIISTNLDQLRMNDGIITQAGISNTIDGSSFNDFISKILKNYYGNNIYSAYIGNKYSKSGTLVDINAIPNLNTYESIQFFLKNYWPFLGVPMMHIDDFYPNPKIVIKFDDIMTANADNNSEAQITEHDKIVRKIETFDSSYQNASIETIDGFNLDDLYLMSKSNIILSTANGIKTIQKNQTFRYLLDNNQLCYESRPSNPFTTILESELRPVDLDKFTELKTNINLLYSNNKISFPLCKFENFDTNQLFKFDKNDKGHQYIYKTVYILERSTQSFNNQYQNNNINTNIFNAKSEIYTIDISNLPKNY